jgi:hypothetical protein
MLKARINTSKIPVFIDLKFRVNKIAHQVLVAITDAINFVSFLLKGELMDNGLKRPANT